MGSSPSALHYNSAQVAILPQFIAFSKCVTMRHIEILGQKLRGTTKSAFCTLNDFQQWLDFGPHLDVFTRYLFDSLKTTPASTKVHGLDLLAALTVCTSTSASLTEKVELLCTLFTYKTSPIMKESDIAILIISTINGLKKITIGLEDTWNATGKSSQDIAKELTTACCIEMKGSSATTKSSIPREEFVAWCLQYKPVEYVLRHFVPGDILNPATSLAQVPYYGKAAQQLKLYEMLLVSINPTESERIQSLREVTATIKIQSMWKRFMAQRLLDSKRSAKMSSLNVAAKKIQEYAKKKKNFLALMQRAAVERLALNGALLTFGSGVCAGTGDLTESTIRGADMVPELKLQSVRSQRVFMSSSCTFVDTDQGWMMWGQCLPMQRENPTTTTFLHRAPMHINLKIDIVSISCGRGHCLVLDSASMVHSWGWNDHGQTGHGSSGVFSARNNGATYLSYYDERTGCVIDYLNAPLKLPYFTGDMEQDALPIPIRQVAAGEFFSMVLSTDGQVFSWGEGSDGQLGHGVDCHFDVGYVDKRLQHSGYTFLHEPKCITPLENIKAIVVNGNRSTALSEDNRVFEWGAWKRMLGEEIEPEFLPKERENVKRFGFCKLALGAEHTIAEGASVWLNLPQSNTSPCFVLLGEHACSIESIRGFDKPFEIAILDINLDDFVDDQANLPKPTSFSREEFNDRMSSTHSSSHESSMEVDDIQYSIEELLDQLWVNRAQEVIPTLEKMKNQHPSMKTLQWPAAVKAGTCDYNDIVEEIMIDITGRVVSFLHCPPEGYYMELLTQDEIVLEVPLCPTSNLRRLTHRGIWSSVVDMGTKRDNYDDIENKIVLIQFTPEDLCIKAALLREDTIVDCISTSLAQLVVTLQEAGAIAVVAGFDFHGTAPFVVQLPSELGLYIPVSLVEMKYFTIAQKKLSKEPHIEARLFHRMDNTPRLIRAALQHGARGILLQQRPPPLNSNFNDIDKIEGDISKCDPYIYPLAYDVDDPLVGMVSYANGQVIRQATHLDDSNHMVVTGEFKVQATGQIYAWGCAENGRLGIGPLSNSHLINGYDPRTDTSYRCAVAPIVVPSLCGRNIADFVCGASHSVARTASGRVFTWGRGNLGQLGHPDIHDKYLPTMVARLAYEVIVDLAANDVCSTIIYESLPTDRYDQRRKEVLLLKAAKTNC